MLPMSGVSIAYTHAPGCSVQHERQSSRAVAAGKPSPEDCTFSPCVIELISWSAELTNLLFLPSKDLQDGRDAADPVSHVGAGMGLDYKPLAALDLTKTSLPTGAGRADEAE
jgi:hypothetical protein